VRESPYYDRQTGGLAIHVKDCYVWAEIQYLDSTTNYREYLHASNVPDLTSSGLKIEDERISYCLEAVGALIFVVFLACIFLVLIIK